MTFTDRQERFKLILNSQSTNPIQTSESVHFESEAPNQLLTHVYFKTESQKENHRPNGIFTSIRTMVACHSWLPILSLENWIPSSCTLKNWTSRKGLSTTKESLCSTYSSQDETMSSVCLSRSYEKGFLVPNTSQTCPAKNPLN